MNDHHSTDHYGTFLREQITLDIEVLTSIRQRAEHGAVTCSPVVIARGFRECELKSRLLGAHQRCGTGHGPCDQIGEVYHPDDERGCTTRAVLGLPYADRPGYRARWRP